MVKTNNESVIIDFIEYSFKMSFSNGKAFTNCGHLLLSRLQ